MRETRRPLTALLLLALAVTSNATETVFIRVSEDNARQPLALQLAIVSYVGRVNGADIQVDLVGAVHIGDRSYYQDLNARFAGYDALLYELIAPKDAVVAERDDNGGIISGTQVAMKDLLDLSFQLDEIDYSATNLVHADLSPEELSASMAERGESLYVYFWRLFYASVAEYGRDPLGLKNVDLLTAAMASDPENSLKALLAYELTDLEKHSEILGEDSESAVIGARNQRALDVLQEQLAAGQRHIGIFYGAAHLPDLEQRLFEQMELSYLSTEWVDAWRLDAGVELE